MQGGLPPVSGLPEGLSPAPPRAAPWQKPRIVQIPLWTAQPGPQTALITCPIFEVFYGGARGGGKTDGMIGDWLAHSAEYGERAVGIFFRRTFVQLNDVMRRCAELFTKIGAKWNGEKAQWTMPGGAILMFRHLDRDRDAENYQGFNLSRVYVEEVTNFPSPAPIDKLRACLRIPGVRCGLRLTGNPGGPGHSWVKKRYIDPNPEGYTIIREDFDNPFTQEVVSLERTFIPSRLIDNKLLMTGQPTYIGQLHQTGSKQLVRAWLLGDWNIIDGAFFAEFDPAIHVLDSGLIERVPSHTYVYKAMDWGYARPFSIGWYAVSDGTWGLPRDALVKLREWYGCTGKPNEGLRLDVPLVAAGILEREMELKRQFNLTVRNGFADPSIFSRDGGPSIMEQFLVGRVLWTRADNQRAPGWQQIRRRLSTLTHVAGQQERKEPELYFLECCADTIRTLPLVQHDERRAEDLDTDGEDHAVDELRYAAMARPHTVDAARKSPQTFPQLPGQMTFSDVMALNRRARLAKEH